MSMIPCVLAGLAAAVAIEVVQWWLAWLAAEDGRKTESDERSTEC